MYCLAIKYFLGNRLVDSTMAEKKTDPIVEKSIP